MPTFNQLVEKEEQKHDLQLSVSLLMQKGLNTIKNCRDRSLCPQKRGVCTAVVLPLPRSRTRLCVRLPVCV
jgi:ribosomal protein S12